MSSRRHLVGRTSRQNEDSSPAPRRNRESEANADPQPAVLPPYEPPSCPLTASTRRAIEQLRNNRDYDKYKKHVDLAVKNVSECAIENNDHLYARRALVEKATNKRKEKQIPDSEKTQMDIDDESYVFSMEKKVGDLTAKAEKALRELIDFKDELAMQDNILHDVSEKITVDPRPAVRRRQRLDDEDEDVEMDRSQAPADDADILSAVELLKNAREEYASKYTAQSMMARYADNKDYAYFKRSVHDALNQGENPPPVPHASTWFSENNAAGSSRRQHAAAVDDDDDDEIVMTHEKTDNRCPLSLQLLTEPYNNNVCRHVFQKDAIMEYFYKEAVAFVPSSQHREAGKKYAKQVQCPQTGCEAMLEEKDFYFDKLLLRQIKRSQRPAATDLEEEDDEKYDGPQRTLNRGRTVAEEDYDHLDVDKSQRISRIKSERGQRRAASRF
ncbi:hypothetical protein B7494_g1941 [Chlorociboria aeruginascens]|nr:hypothetical protein B7494_g1941 [Chlorociboria aeruginascens]